MSTAPGDRPAAVFLMGPTCAGKTALAIELAERLPCNIISVDSAMIYRGMDIGTAKPGAAALARAPHRLIDICDPAERYSAAQFRTDALREMGAITAHGRIPLLVGGTGLYFRALEAGLSRLPPADEAVRGRLRQEAAEHGLQQLHRRLAAVDPAAAARIHHKDLQRIQRALEVYEVTGRPMTELLRAGTGPGLPYRLIKLVLSPAERGVLHARVRTRFSGMLAAGLIEEVRRLYIRGDLHAGLPAIRVVGYRQVWSYLAGAIDRGTMVEQAVTATRQLAKRQLTWLRAERGGRWVEPQQTDLTVSILRTLETELGLRK